MGKISEAIEKSFAEKSNGGKKPVPKGGGKKPNRGLEEILSTGKRFRMGTSSGLDKNLIAAINPHSIEAEQFKLLKTNLLFPAEGVPPKIIMVTSAVPGEGKSFVAANLAISIAQNIDEHVLLIDSDLRLPTIHKLFGLGVSAGLSETLSGRASLESVFRKVGIDKLTILPAGQPPHNASELLSSEQMGKLLAEVRNRYADRYIIIDTAPPKLTAESSAIATKVDGILLVINQGKTQKEAILDLVNNLGRDKIIGVVMNRFDLKSSSYYGKYTQYYQER